MPLAGGAGRVKWLCLERSESMSIDAVGRGRAGAERLPGAAGKARCRAGADKQPSVKGLSCR